MYPKPINIIKASGEVCQFSKDKLISSLLRSGANDSLVTEVVSEVYPLLYEGITTRKIFKIAFKLLKKKNRSLAAKYKLKDAIMELGPSGFPFEKYVSEILKHQGYSTTVGDIVQGKCVSHEVDVIAIKGKKHLMIECKYHNLRGVKCSVKTPLYIHSRFNDVVHTWKKEAAENGVSYQGWVVTNTKFSADAIQYGECAGLHIVSWNYPKVGSLKEQIDNSRLFPITCMTALTGREKRVLLDNNIVLCLELVDNPHILNKYGIRGNRITPIIKEARAICGV